MFLLDLHALRPNLEVSDVLAPFINDPVSIQAFNLSVLKPHLALSVASLDLPVLSVQFLIFIEETLDELGESVADDGGLRALREVL